MLINARLNKPQPTVEELWSHHSDELLFTCSQPGASPETIKTFFRLKGIRSQEAHVPKDVKDYGRVSQKPRGRRDLMTLIRNVSAYAPYSPVKVPKLGENSLVLPNVQGALHKTREDLPIIMIKTLCKQLSSLRDGVAAAKKTKRYIDENENHKLAIL